MTTTEAQPEQTPLEKMITSIERQYKRSLDSGKALTLGDLSNFVLNTLVPLVREVTTEYNDGFAAVEEQLDADVGGGSDAASDVVEKAREAVGQLTLFVATLMKDRGWADEQGNPLPAMPEPIQQAYGTVATSLLAFKDAVDVYEAELDDEEDEEDDEDEGGETPPEGAVQ